MEQITTIGRTNIPTNTNKNNTHGTHAGCKRTKKSIQFYCHETHNKYKEKMKTDETNILEIMK